jgi:hypothetical protein
MNAQELIDTARTLVAGDEGLLLLDVDNTPLDNDRFAADFGARLQQAFGAAERERFLAVKRVVAQTERGLDAAAGAGSARHGAI